MKNWIWGILFLYKLVYFSNQIHLTKCNFNVVFLLVNRFVQKHNNKELNLNKLVKNVKVKPIQRQCNGLNKKDRTKARGTQKENGRVENHKVRKEGLQSPQRKECWYRFRNYDIEKSIQIKNIVASREWHRCEGILQLYLVVGLCPQATHLQERITKRIDRFSIVREPTNKNYRTQVPGRWYYQVRIKPHIYLR